ncbi:PREDICTED: uncharacterized protein LOC109152215 [Ipomoea nil]|uniref:uncharacterized protein LOC109152215 n=1 Tax=Ipomoea nil TaxID=35883 RepID=UPI000900DA98|nr:PREDICTED: uncharacterized protein LOC109152215 [Ipomoea nil]
MHCRSLPNPREGDLSIRLITGATATPSDSAVDATVHDNTVEFIFDPHYELPSLDRSIRFFSGKLEAFFGLDPQVAREIAHHMGNSAYNCLRGRRCGLYMSVELETRPPPPAAAEVILGNIVFNGGGGDRSGECCNVCLEDFEGEEVITQLAMCLHKFHNECIAKWLRRSRTCPICRGRV